jgi:hypothetical protein
MKILVKKHDSSLNTIKAHFDDLKRALESVRAVSSGVNDYEDLRKFDAIITQLKERWERAVGAYGVRRSNLKKCLYAYHEHIKAINNEKQGLSATAQPNEENNRSRTSNNGKEEFIRINGAPEPKIAVIKNNLNQRKNSSEALLSNGHQMVDTQLAQITKVSECGSMWFIVKCCVYINSLNQCCMSNTLNIFPPFLFVFLYSNNLNFNGKFALTFPVLGRFYAKKKSNSTNLMFRCA